MRIVVSILLTAGVSNETESEGDAHVVRPMREAELLSDARFVCVDGCQRLTDVTKGVVPTDHPPLVSHFGSTVHPDARPQIHKEAI